MIGQKSKESSPDRKTQNSLERARSEWFERMGSPIVERNRYFIIAVVMGLLLIAHVVALVSMMPLTRVVPYIVRTDQHSGAITAAPVTAKDFKPVQAEQQYFIVQWVRHLLELDPYVTERNLADAYQLTRGKAIDEFTDYIKQTQPIARVKENQSLTRAVNVRSVSFIDANSALVRVATEERTLGQSPAVKNFVITVHFLIQPPATEAEIIRNPIGIFITHFAISEELSQWSNK